ncbi:hypothetical protein ACLOJK_033963 [Asimina triloba]
MELSISGLRLRLRILRGASSSTLSQMQMALSCLSCCTHPSALAISNSKLLSRYSSLLPRLCPSSKSILLCRLGGGGSRLLFRNKEQKSSVRDPRVSGRRGNELGRVSRLGAGETGVESGEEDEEGEEKEEEDIEVSVAPERWDVLGLGQAMVDFSGMVDDAFLERLGIEKGTRKVVNHEERGRVLRAMDGCSYKAAAGGSLSNSLVGLARLGSEPIGGPRLHVAMVGSVGSDPLGGFYRSLPVRAKLRRANVDFLSAPVKDGTTGTVIVLTTPDAQRTMLAYQGTSSTINYDPFLAGMIAETKILFIEGYLFEFPGTTENILKACEDAHKTGALIAVTASDVSCVERYYDRFWKIIGNYADIVFANTNEARALCQFSGNESPSSMTRYLSHFVPLVSVTDGPKGSYVGVKGEAVYIPPTPCMPVDTCGAGDAYASGFLYGILRGVSDLKGMGMLASRVAAVVVGQQGTRLRVQDAGKLAGSFADHLESSEVCSDVGSDQISSV